MASRDAVSRQTIGHFFSGGGGGGGGGGPNPSGGFKRISVILLSSSVMINAITFLLKTSFFRPPATGVGSLVLSFTLNSVTLTLSAAVKVTSSAPGFLGPATPIFMKVTFWPSTFFTRARNSLSG